MDTAIEISKQLGPIAALCVIAALMIGKALNKMIDRFLAGFDKLAEKIDKHTEADAKLLERSLEFEGEIAERIGRLSSRIDGALGRRAPSDSDQPPTRRARTNPHGVPVRRRRTDTDEE
jgi:hypothetical protein